MKLFPPSNFPHHSQRRHKSNLIPIISYYKERDRAWELVGDRKTSKKAGSSLIRMALWQWVFTRIEPKKNRVKNATIKALGEIFNREKEQSRPIRRVRSRSASRVTDWLFAELVKELVTSNN